MTRRFYSAVQALHPWLPLTDMPGMLRESRRLLDRYPQGEAAMIVGSVLHGWKQGNCDGAVTVDTWRCGPALVAESLLRHQREIPMLFVRTDGTPIDERRLAGFAFRLRSKPPRRAAEPARSPSRS